MRSWPGFGGGIVRLGGREFGPERPLVMGIVNRTPDSFYDRGATFADDAAMARVDEVVAHGADIVDIGGVKAGHGAPVDAQEEIRRVVPFVARVRERHPGLVISVDTWRAEVARRACEVGADLINDAWGGVDTQLPGVVAAAGAGLVCTHTGGARPRSNPHRVRYADVMADAIEATTTLAARAVEAGVDPRGVLIDPAHDFTKTTWDSLEVTRRLDEMVVTGWPVLISVSNKDFIGESLGLPVRERGDGTNAVTAVAAWLGARVHRVHDVAATRRTVDMVACVRGDRPPERPVRGLA